MNNDRVEAKSVEDFLARFYKPTRYTGRGEEYAAGLLASYEAEFERNGSTFISCHDSVTGNYVSFYGVEKKEMGMRYTISPAVEWPNRLLKAIEQARDGDTIELCNDDMFIIARVVQDRICPDKELTFEIVTQPDPLEMLYG